jgi:endonuclease YncB( thermonuclease family)
MKKILILMLFPVLVHSQGIDFEKLIPFTVTSVFDGDGFKGHYQNGAPGEIRLLCVDAPEKRGYSTLAQDYGNQAGDSLRALIKGKTVYLDTFTIRGQVQSDRFGRTLAIAYLQDTTNLNFHIVDRGWAWAVSGGEIRKQNLLYVLKNAQREAKGVKRGLWAGRNIHTPTYHRKHYSVFR